jgi:hypothetical protein
MLHLKVRYGKLARLFLLFTVQIKFKPWGYLVATLAPAGAVSPTGEICIRPAHTECVEAFQWLAQEIQQA